MVVAATAALVQRWIAVAVQSIDVNLLFLLLFLYYFMLVAALQWIHVSLLFLILFCAVQWHSCRCWGCHSSTRLRLPIQRRRLWSLRPWSVVMHTDLDSQWKEVFLLQINFVLVLWNNTEVVLKLIYLSSCFFWPWHCRIVQFLFLCILLRDHQST